MSIAEDLAKVQPVAEQLEEMDYSLWSPHFVHLTPTLKTSDLIVRRFGSLKHPIPRYEDICSDISNRFKILDL